MVDMLVSGIVVLLLDQSAKRAVGSRGSVVATQCGPVGIRNVSTRRHLYTRTSTRVSLVVVWLAALTSAIMLDAGGSFYGKVASVAVGAALGGAASNLLDILRDRSVRDYIDLGWWPVFNIADVAIIGGLGLAFIPIW